MAARAAVPGPHPSRRPARAGLLRACESLSFCLSLGGGADSFVGTIRSRGDAMTSAGLFGDLPETDGGGGEGRGAPRLREPVRDQIELRAVDLDALLGPE